MGGCRTQMNPGGLAHLPTLPSQTTTHHDEWLHTPQPGLFRPLSAPDVHVREKVMYWAGASPVTPLLWLSECRLISNT